MQNPANPNDNPLCGTKISIFNPNTGATTEATIVDTCVGCQEYDIDVTETLFDEIVPGGSGVGRQHGIDWGGPAVGG